MLRVIDVRCGFVTGVSRGDVSIWTSLALKGAWSGVVGGVPICFGRGEGSKGEYGGVFTRGLQKGLSISAEAIRVWLHGILDRELGLVIGSLGSLLMVVCESERVNGGVVVESWVGGLGLVLGSAIVESGDEQGLSLGAS